MERATRCCGRAMGQRLLPVQSSHPCPIIPTDDVTAVAMAMPALHHSLGDVTAVAMAMPALHHSLGDIKAVAMVMPALHHSRGGMQHLGILQEEGAGAAVPRPLQGRDRISSA